jgi:uroporphyrinogen decarboxylase
MQSRQRLLWSLDHKEPDRVPIDLASTQVTAIALNAYQNLRKYLGLPKTSPIVSDRIQQICIPDDDINQKFGVDVKGLWPLMNANDFTDQDDSIYLHHVDEWGLGYRLNKKDGLWYDLYMSPMQSVRLSKRYIDNYPWPNGGAKHRVEGLRDQAIGYHKKDYPVFLKSVCAGLLEMAIRLRGMENFLLDLIIDQRNAEFLLDKILEVKLDYWQTALEELRDVVDVIAEADDFGTQTSQLISHDIFRAIIKPRQVELISFMKRKPPRQKFSSIPVAIFVP